ncbi:hypothetical protein KL86SPO_31648 [uncultured Sporomusa sp.]|uniref:Uncharacterized protein n=1 Tax=uncultured Sporomusa sp. TaxID=307249 RepID=A0A212LVN4_9FIRM|nr:hypothetical protein KL86SPO_31648 [uncultured Sporomusa sp.]
MDKSAQAQGMMHSLCLILFTINVILFVLANIMQISYTQLQMSMTISINYEMQLYLEVTLCVVLSRYVLMPKNIEKRHIWQSF